MSVRSIVLLLSATVWFSLDVSAQSQSQSQSSGAAGARTETQTASNVSAELVKGKLSPAHSKPGDQVEMRLKDDVKSNGQVVLKKGTVVTGVVRSVKQMDSKSSASGQAQSMMDVEWLAPEAQGAGQVMFAVQSLSSISPLSQASSDDATESGFLNAGPPAARPAPARSGSGGGLLGGVVGTTTSTVGTATGSVVNTATGPVASTTSASSNGQSNVALMKMPSIVAADQQTSSMIQHNLDLSGDQQIFRTGHGEVVSAGGSRQSVDFFSRMANDTVLTSNSKDFEITSGAMMQLAVGVKR